MTELVNELKLCETFITLEATGYDDFCLHFKGNVGRQKE